MTIPSKLRLLLAALLAIAVIAIYARMARYDFISIDDNEYVYENEHVTHGLSGANVVWAFKTPVAGNWHPLTMLSHMLVCQFFGPRPGAHHLANALLHLANTLLLFWVLLKMTDRPTALVPARPANRSSSALAPPASNLWPCALVAALFALHPLHVESVAWISERKDVLSACFFLLTLLAYTQYVTSLTSHPRTTLSAPRPLLWYALSLLLFLLGLLSKPMLVTLPCVLLLLDYWPLRRLKFRSKNEECRSQNQPKPNANSSNFNLHPSSFIILLEKLPFLALTLAFSVVTFLVQRNSGAVVGFEDMSLKPRLANAVVAYARYLGKTFWPDALAIPYPYQQWPADAVLGASLLLGVLSLLALAAARRRPYLFVGWFWFVGMLVPVIGVVQAGFQSMADRFTYLPLIGLFIALAWWLTAMPFTASRRRLVAATAVVGLAALTVTTWAQVGQWKNSVTLFEHAVRVDPNNSAARYLLGAQYDAQGQPEQAFVQFAEAVRANPANARARCGLGYLLCQQGKLDEAGREYETALQSQPDSAKAHFGLAEVLRRQGRVDPAIAHYLAALQLKPDLAEAHYQVAGCFSAKHDPTNTLAHLQAAVHLAPDWPLALNNLAWALATQPQAGLRNGPEATRLALRVVSLTGRDNPSTLDTLAAAYAEADRFADAVATAQAAIQQANAAGQTNLAAEIASRLQLYQSQKAYRE